MVPDPDDPPAMMSIFNKMTNIINKADPSTTRRSGPPRCGSVRENLTRFAYSLVRQESEAEL